MQLLLKRRKSTTNSTIGDLYVNGVPVCYTCEDVVRELPDKPVSEWKVPGQTAIPVGTYPVVINFSPHFGRLLPLVENVPGFEGIRIHPGNTDLDTEGCILPGLEVQGEEVLRSREACAMLQMDIQAGLAKDGTVTLTVVNFEEVC